MILSDYTSRGSFARLQSGGEEPVEAAGGTLCRRALGRNSIMVMMYIVTTMAAAAVIIKEVIIVVVIIAIVILVVIIAE